MMAEGSAAKPAVLAICSSERAVGTLLSRLLLEDVRRIELLLPEESKRRTMVFIRSSFGDQVDRRAFRAPVSRREALCADHEFLNSLERKLHHGTTDSVVFVVHAIDSYVDVPATLAIYRQNCIAVLGRVIRIRGFHARR